MADLLLEYVRRHSWDTALIVVAGDGAVPLSTIVRVFRARHETRPEQAQSDRAHAYLFARSAEESAQVHADATVHGVEEYCSGFATTLELGAPFWRPKNTDLLIVGGVSGRSAVDRAVAGWLPNMAAGGLVYVQRPVDAEEAEDAEGAVKALARSRTAGLFLLETEEPGWLLGRREWAAWEGPQPSGGFSRG